MPKTPRRHRGLDGLQLVLRTALAFALLSPGAAGCGGGSGSGGNGTGGQGSGGSGSGGSGSGGNGSGGSASGGVIGSGGNASGGVIGSGGSASGGSGSGGSGGSASGGSSSGGSVGSGGSGSGGTGSGGATASGGGSGTSPLATWANVRDVVENGCHGSDCHVQGEQEPFLLGLNATSLSDTDLYTKLTTFKADLCGNRVLVKPGAPDDSAFYLAQAGKCGALPQMPFGCKPEYDNCTPMDQLEGIRQWIAAGAAKP